jgi:hypothetical protein
VAFISEVRKPIWVSILASMAFRNSIICSILIKLDLNNPIQWSHIWHQNITC